MIPLPALMPILADRLSGLAMVERSTSCSCRIGAWFGTARPR